MRLIHAHIENFGKLHDYDVDFHDGLNEIICENGWGKSTLVSFIRVMFYGFDNSNARKELKNEKKRFEPWQGGIYGGSLVFEKDGTIYRAERVFDKKNRFELYDHETNLKSNDYSENLGEELFGVDRDSFSKTVFIGQQACATGTTSKINAMIGSVSEDADDMAMYDNAMETLQNESNRLSSTRKTGAISKLQDEIAKIQSDVSAKEWTENVYSEAVSKEKECYEAIKEQRTLIEQYDLQLQGIAENNEQWLVAQDYKTKCEELQNAEIAFFEAKAKFPKGVPSLDEIDTITETDNRISGLQEVLDRNAFGETEEKEWASLESHFGNGSPTKDELDEIKTLIGQIEIIKSNQQTGNLSKQDYLELEKLNEKYGEKIPEDEQINSLIEEKKRQNQLEEQLKEKKSDYTERLNQLWREEYNKKTEVELERKRNVEEQKHVAWILIVGGILIALLGLVFWINSSALLFSAFTLAGVITALYGFIKRPKNDMTTDMRFNEKEFETDSELTKLKAEEEELEKQIDEIKQNRCSFFEKYNRSIAPKEEQDYLYQLREEMTNYKKLRQSVPNGEDNKELYAMSESVGSFFEGFGIESDIDSHKENIIKLEHMIQQYERFNKKNDDQSGIKGEQEKKRTEIQKFLNKYGLPSCEGKLNMTSLRDDVIEYVRAKDERERRREPVERIEEEIDVSKFDELKHVDVVVIDQINEMKQKAQEEIDAQQSQLQTLENDEHTLYSSLQDIYEKEGILENKNELLEQMQWEERIVKLTESKLEEAKNSFLKHYRAPIKNAFDSYYAMLSGENADEYEIDSELNISKRSFGLQRNIEMMSEGYKDLIGLCRRMAMVDAMYEDEKPFLIFDDSFVNLDDKKLDYSLEFMKKIAEKYQVIYTTCHTSRTV